MNILLMEDDDRIVSFLRRGLEAEGHTINVALSQEECLALVAQHAFDVIVVDVFLGDTNGVEICRTLRGLNIETPIAIMTAKDSPEIRTESQRAGANAYISKPFSFNMLIQTLEKLSTTLTLPLQVP